jgi:choline dehydrogenase-like flavoprotein
VPETNIGFIKACQAANIPIVHELNTGNGTGVKQGTGCMDSQYRRSSSYDSYYKRALGRPNLSVLHDAYVSEIVTSTDSGSPRADGVFFKDGPTGLFHTVTARKEVIVSMGAFHTPQLLMISVSLSSRIAMLGPVAHRVTGYRIS